MDTSQHHNGEKVAHGSHHLFFPPPEGFGGGFGGCGLGLLSWAIPPFLLDGGFAGCASMRDDTTPLADRLAEAQIDTLKEVVRNAESFLGGQLISGLASNQRAMTLTSVLAAATVVLGGAAASLLVGTTPNPPLSAVCGLVAAGFLISMALAISAAKPADWYLSGNTPAGWVEDVEAKKKFERSLAEQAAWYADMIADNHATMERADRKIIMALQLAWASLATGALLCAVLFGLTIN